MCSARCYVREILFFLQTWWLHICLTLIMITQISFTKKWSHLSLLSIIGAGMPIIFQRIHHFLPNQKVHRNMWNFILQTVFWPNHMFCWTERVFGIDDWPRLGPFNKETKKLVLSENIHLKSICRHSSKGSSQRAGFFIQNTVTLTKSWLACLKNINWIRLLNSSFKWIDRFRSF